MCVFVWVSLHTSAGAYGVQKRTSDSGLRAGVRGNCVLGIRTKLGSSVRTVNIPTRIVPASEAIILSKP